MTSMAASRPESKDLSDAFIKISFQEDRESDPLMGHWLDQGSAKHSSPLVLLSQLLQQLYPGHSLVVTQDSRLNLLSFPNANVQPISPHELITTTFFASLPKNYGPVPGVLFDSVEYGAFKAFWQVGFINMSLFNTLRIVFQGKQFILYIIRVRFMVLSCAIDMICVVAVASRLWHDDRALHPPRGPRINIPRAALSCRCLGRSAP